MIRMVDCFLDFPFACSSILFINVYQLKFLFADEFKNLAASGFRKRSGPLSDVNNIYAVKKITQILR